LCLGPSCARTMSAVEDLQEKVADLQKQNDILGMENEMLADYLQRDADRSAGLDDTDEAFSDMPSPGDKGAKGRSQPARGQQRAGQRHVRLPTSLTLEEKFRIANQEVEALTKDMEQTKKDV